MRAEGDENREKWITGIEKSAENAIHIFVCDGFLHGSKGLHLPDFQSSKALNLNFFYQVAKRKLKHNMKIKLPYENVDFVINQTKEYNIDILWSWILFYLI